MIFGLLQGVPGTCKSCKAYHLTSPFASERCTLHAARWRLMTLKQIGDPKLQDRFTARGRSMVCGLGWPSHFKVGAHQNTGYVRVRRIKRKPGKCAKDCRVQSGDRAGYYAVRAVESGSLVSCKFPFLGVGGRGSVDIGAMMVFYMDSMKMRRQRE